MKSETFPKCAIKLLVFNFVLTCVFPLRQPINYTYLESLWTQSQFNFFIFTAFFSFERSYRSYKMKTELSHCQSFLNVARVKIIHWGLFHKWLFKKKIVLGLKWHSKWSCLQCSYSKSKWQFKSRLLHYQFSFVLLHPRRWLKVAQVLWVSAIYVRNLDEGPDS